jgi:ketosteroid isomerase-like protein
MKEVVLNFIEAINAADVENICSLMDTRYVFIDNVGQEHKGVQLMKSGCWQVFADTKVQFDAMK